MIRLVVLGLCLSAVFAATLDGKETRIVGGVNALAGEYPYIVSIQRSVLLRFNHICGGSILNTFHVLTAAQCFFSNPNSRYRVQAGKLYLNSVEITEQTINVQRVTLHPGFNGGVSPYDIAVVRLASPFGLTSMIQPIVLPVIDSIPSGVVRIAGWGSISMGWLPSMPNHLQQTRVAIFPNLECQIIQGGSGIGPVTVNNVCLGPITGGISACDGDTGGPVVQVDGDRNVLVGIISWYPSSCGQSGIPTVSVRVSAFIEWINLHSAI
ncbi:trypsin-1-like isoform X2 [Topomyia yanbarensis]|uniref:trypsin-1-like isoform X2 n=1 Tax=Topomyia yanbarensis TaxID=2498891 RepID=UPI00273B3278|nr:trypsin-1-like isoform X2 [Topomyia yanbarensis]